jgi:uncharacterized membrane protein YfcA
MNLLLPPRSSLAYQGFGLVAAAIWLQALGPAQTTALIAAYALLVQGYAVWRLRKSIVPARLWPFVVGSAIGVPIGRRSTGGSTTRCFERSCFGCFSSRVSQFS